MTAESIVYFLDSSYLVSAYLADERTHEDSHALLRGPSRLIVSELAAVEASSAIANAGRARRLPPAQRGNALEDLERDLGPGGPVEMLSLDAGQTLERAKELVILHPTGTLAAIHLAVAEREGRALAGDDLVFTTYDERQREVAAKLGLAVG